jgi:hypothetical protein
VNSSIRERAGKLSLEKIYKKKGKKYARHS